MTFLGLFTCVALIAFAALGAAGSLASTTLWVLLSRWLPHSSARRATLLFSLRVLPTVAALVLVAGLIVPSFLALEPRNPGEVLGARLLLPAMVTVLVVGVGLARGLRAWRATRRLVAGWMQTAEPISLPGIAVPAYRIEHPFPVVCLAGIVRPRLFVARQIIERFTNRELAAVTDHEAGHLAARDNLKGLLMRACPDWLAVLPVGRHLEQAWSRMAEQAADDAALDPFS